MDDERRRGVYTVSSGGMLEQSISDILETVQGYAPDADVNTLMTAYLLAARAHSGQTRKSGEPYLTHPLAVAGILADLRMDVETIATALLHDALEDNPITKEEMKAEIGETITELVDGVTKIGKLKFKSQQELAAENFRKMMLAMSRDLRVILVKLADRLHNMSTLEFHRPEKRKKIATETMEVFVPIANRLGLATWKARLSDLCFKNIEPEAYQHIMDFLADTQKDREAYTEAVVLGLQERLTQQGLKAKVMGRAKNPYSIYQKMQRTGLDVSELSDLLAFRVLLPDVNNCYHALGLVHSAFPPIPDRIKDYIARPKPNGYQSIHTTVCGPENRRVEVQIRTEDMERVANNGIAAHWRYKEGHLTLSPEDVLRIGKIRDLFESTRDIQSASEFMETLKGEFYADEVFIFTPAGDIKKLRLGATALDFAYAVHTDVGNHCTGARVNGRQVPLRYQLQSGDSVEVTTNEQQHPRRDWLSYCQTGRALQKIRKYLREEEVESGERLGRTMLEAELRRFAWTVERAQTEGNLKQVCKANGYANFKGLFVGIARGQNTPSEIVKSLLPEGVFKTRLEATQQNALVSLFSRLRKPSQSPVLITGEDGMLVNYARCCGPLPGELVTGFITRGRGITVHRRNCPQVKGLDPDRFIPVEWDSGVESSHSGEIDIFCNDRPGMLANISRLCEKNGVNISRAEAVADSDHEGAQITLEVAVRDVAELNRLIKNIEKIKGVEMVSRRN